MVVALAHATKHQLAEWSPTYFRPRDGAEERHAAYLDHLVRSDDQRATVLIDAHHVVGFFNTVQQPSHRWVDDLYVDDPRRWPPAVRLLVSGPSTPWVTCVSRFDDERAGAFRAAGLDVASTYWGRLLPPYREDGPPRRPEIPWRPGSVADAPTHTFGGRALDPESPGALIVVDEGGYVIGSAGMEPPLYDPGGPACVVDRVEGSDRSALLSAAMTTAAARGDAAMVAVCATTDIELAELLEAAGFRAEVDLFAGSGRPA